MQSEDVLNDCFIRLLIFLLYSSILEMHVNVDECFTRNTEVRSSKPESINYVTFSGNPIEPE